MYTYAFLQAEVIISFDLLLHVWPHNLEAFTPILRFRRHQALDVHHVPAWHGGQHRAGDTRDVVHVPLCRWGDWGRDWKYSHQQLLNSTRPTSRSLSLGSPCVAFIFSSWLCMMSSCSSGLRGWPLGVWELLSQGLGWGGGEEWADLFLWKHKKSLKKDTHVK